MNEVKRILNFWKELNLLTPISLEGSNFTKEEYLKKNGEKRKKYLSETLKISYFNGKEIRNLLEIVEDKYKNCSIEIGFGNIKNTYLYEKIGIEEDIVDGDGGKSFIFSFTVDSEKKYQEGSFSISKFVYILLKNLLSDDYKNIKEKIDTFNFRMEETLKSYSNQDIESLNNNLQNFTDFLLKELDVDILEKEKVFYFKLFYPNDDDKSSFLQMDFYTEDLENIKQKISEKSFLNNLIYSKLDRKDCYKVDDDVEFIQEITLPKNMPLGRWPSKHNPSLMQAVAINICTSKEYSPNIFSVNGPPGTGKTTLLKEIIADTIVEKANIISKLDLKDIKKVDIKEVKNYNQYSKIPDELKKLGIIVASNNNAAVENISKELPTAKDVFTDETLSGLFDINKRDDVYFTLASDEIFKNKEKDELEKTKTDEKNKKWGLISAPYGKGKNIKKLLEILPNVPEVGKKIDDFKFKLEDIPNLEEAKEKFNAKYEEVIKYRKRLNYYVNQFIKRRELGKNIKVYENNLKNLSEDIEKNLKDIEQKELILKDVEKEKKNLESSYSIFTKILKLLFGEKNPKILECKRRIVELNKEIISTSKDVTEKSKDRLSLETKINDFNCLKYINEEIIETYLVGDKEEQKNQWIKCLEERFYNDIAHNAESQAICPWGIEEFNKLREELFASSLQLIKAFILNSSEIKQNLKIFKELQDRKSSQKLGYSDKERKEAFKECFHTLNLLIPVLSTTFASVSRVFKDFEENELGMAIIDEAGQATPFSAMGLLYRANRCIIVGDPLQVEPVMTTPLTLIRNRAIKNGTNELEKEFKVASNIYRYTSPSLSIQTLADSANLYYGKIGETEVGCPLVVHRRCLSPMFDISNRISYDNRMINKCMSDKKDKKYVLEKNEFIDVRGTEKGNKNHYVEEQGKKVIEIIKNSIKDRNIAIFDDKEFKNLYVISPFTTVINGLKNDIKKAFKDQDEKKVEDWCDKCLGTVHKFQGKEANSVILLLGCDNNSKSSAQWAAQAANILNVAATRAKKRFAIIGDLELWGKLNFFKDAKEVLDEFNKK